MVNIPLSNLSGIPLFYVKIINNENDLVITSALLLGIVKHYDDINASFKELKELIIMTIKKYIEKYDKTLKEKEMDDLAKVIKNEKWDGKVELKPSN